MIPAEIIKKLTPEQLRQARRLYIGNWDQSSKFNG